MATEVEKSGSPSALATLRDRLGFYGAATTWLSNSSLHEANWPPSDSECDDYELEHLQVIAQLGQPVHINAIASVMGLPIDHDQVISEGLSGQFGTVALGQALEVCVLQSTDLSGLSEVGRGLLATVNAWLAEDLIETYESGLDVCRYLDFEIGDEQAAGPHRVGSFRLRGAVLQGMEAIDMLYPDALVASFEGDRDVIWGRLTGQKYVSPRVRMWYSQLGEDDNPHEAFSFYGAMAHLEALTLFRRVFVAMRRGFSA